MPPEPLPWDRKDFFKERKHDRSESVGSITRWKDSSHHGSRGFGRWGQDEFRRPPGHGKQGGYQLFSEESGHGGPPSRTSERMAGDENSLRPAVTRGDGKHGRNTWEIRGAFSLKDLKGRPWEASDASVNSSGRQHYMSAQRSVSDLLTYTSHPHSDIENSSWDQLNFKDQHDKMGSVDGLGTGHIYDTAQSLDPIAWKPMKWNRSSSLASRSSGFSHSNSPRSLRSDSDETKLDLPAERATPVQSPSGDNAGGVASSAEFEDTCPRKKQRLGWGQGLAKYEKQKVEGSDETVSRNGLVPCESNAKISQSIIPILPDKSPRVTGLSECASPATTSSVACSSSPGLVEKSHNKSANNDIDTSNLSSSPGHGFQISVEEFSLSLEHVELNSVAKLSSLLIDLMQLEDASSGDSNYVKSTAMNKLMLLKSDISKALEKTECEIDLFENELKLLRAKLETDGSRPTSDSLQVDFESKSREVDAVSKAFQKLVPLQLVSSADLPLEKPILCNYSLEKVSGEVKDNDVDSPGTATSKFVESLSMDKAVSTFVTGNQEGCSADYLAARSISSEGQCFMPFVDEKKSTSVSGCRDGNDQIEPTSSECILGDLSQPSNAECKVNVLILVSNRDSARKAFEVFSKLLPSNQSQIDIWGASSTSCEKNTSLFKEKLVIRKCFLRFKKQVLTLKFRVFQHLWKEDMRLLSIRKYRAKSLKRFELNSRASNSGYQKHRSSIRSRFTSPAGNLTLVPTTDIVDFTSKLLSDSQIKLYRNSLKMPSLILDDKEKRLSRFVTSNGLVEDPCAIEKEKKMINPWMPDEKEIFLEKLATYGKDFKNIASFLNHKTTGDCIEFYYKNHKSEAFEKIKKKSEIKKQEKSFPTNTYMVTSGKKWNREVNAASLDLLGAASVIAARADDSMKTQTCVRPSFLGGHYEYKTCWGVDALCEKSSSKDILGNEREAAAADALAGICGALSSEAMSSCVTSSVDPGEGCQEWKFQKRNSVTDHPLTPEVMQSIDDEEICSDESCGELDSVDWTDEEKSKFIRALRSYGKDFAKISRCVGTRSRNQCKIFFSKARKCLGLDVVHPGSGNEDKPVSDANGDRSDTEDVSVLEMESAICSTQSCSKMYVDFPLPVTDTNCEVSGYAGTHHLQTEPDRSGEKNGMRQIDLRDVEIGIETLILGDCLEGVKPDLVFHGNNNLVGGTRGKVDATPEVTQSNDAVKTDATLRDPTVPFHGNMDLTAETEAAEEQRSGLSATPIGESLCIEGPAELAQSMSNAATKSKASPGSSAEHLKIESDHQQFLLPESVYDGRQDVKTGLDTESSRSSSCYLVPESNAKGNASHPVSETRVPPSFSLTPNHEPQISLELLSSVQKARNISWQQKENCPSNLASRDSSVIPCDNHLRQATSSSVLNFEEPGNKQHQKPSSADLHQQHQLGHHSLDRVESSQILRGYPLQVLNKREINGHVDSIGDEKYSLVQNFSKINRNIPSNHVFMQDIYHENCSGSKLLHTVTELPLLSRNHEQSSGHSRSLSQSSSDTEDHSRRVGDFKLFGQILSHPSTLQKPIHPNQETGIKGATLPKSSSKSFNLKFTTDHGAERMLVPVTIDTGNYSNLEDFPMRSYGFWDGNRIQTGLPSLPDSAILLAKYPAAFGDHSASSNGDQFPKPAVFERNDRNRASVFPAKDVSSSNGGLSDYHPNRSCSGAKVQPLTVDLKRHDVFSDMQKRNGFEVSSFQQQGRGGMVGMNVMGAGILVGGGCTGVSDPVAAIKMHYATAERYNGQAASIREEDSWRADVGR